MVSNSKPILAPSITLAPQLNAPPPPARADVVEQAWVVNRDVPGMVTIQLTLKNRGGATARGVQAFIAPYLGAIPGSDGINMRAKSISTTADSPLGQIGQWVSYGDIAAGQTATSSAQFAAQPGVDPVPSNTHPKLLYTSSQP